MDRPSTVVWKGAQTADPQLEFGRPGGPAGHAAGRIRLTPGTLTPAERAAYPHLTGYPAFTVDPRDRALLALRA
ncbi:hypothetical protein [Streptomyces sp. NPDC004296]|uniref:hypothetical protein n=1 Tax=Streptomyces sp. NPDC004296 TaxID=3364697 RepID=UPI0036B6216A